MNRNSLLALIIASAVTPAWTQEAAAPNKVNRAEPEVAAAASNRKTMPSPAEQKIAWAESVLKEKPKNAPAWNALGMAYARRARETADPSYYDKAQVALDNALKAAPGDYDARRTRIWVFLGQHEFQKALTEARKLNKEFPDDVLVYGFLTDACVELGQYEEAEKACQWMLDLRPGNVPGLTRAAYLRESFGMLPGAVAFMNDAFEQTSISETEDRAWILTHIAHLELMQGHVDLADEAVRRALALFPRYHYALQQKARVEAARGEHAKAAETLQARYDAAPHPENLFELAVALERSGRRDEAQKSFAEFESLALAESGGNDNANRELIWYFADHAGKPAEALRLAKEEMERRQDIHTRHAYAWALFRSGQTSEARRQIDEILAIGYREATLLFHAGRIAAAEHDRDAAQALHGASFALNPHSPVAAEAKAALAPAGPGSAK
jgi:tetratricopeptide (TPR) repeat protein